MQQQQHRWMYLLRAEDSTAETRDCLAPMGVSRLLRAGKTLLWLGISILMSIGVGQLG